MKHIILLLFIICVQLSFSQKILSKIKEGNLKAVQKYIKKKDINTHFSLTESQETYSLLAYAIIVEQNTIAQEILKHKNEFKDADAVLNQALEKAIEYENHQIFNELIKQGVKVTGQYPRYYDDRGTTIKEDIYMLAYAAYYGQKEMLLEIMKDKDQFVNLQGALDQALVKATIKGELEICQYLVEQGANVDALCNICYSRSVLQIAVSHEYWELAEFYLEQGANKMFITEGNWNLLHSIACSNNVDFAKKYISLFDVNTKDNEGQTPLNYAANHGNEKMFDFLTQQGGDWQTKDKYGDDLLMHVIHGQNQKIVKKLLDKGFGVDSKDHDGNTPLVWSIWLADSALAKFLIEQGADTSILIQEKNYLQHAKQYISDIDFLNYLQGKMNK